MKFFKFVPLPYRVTYVNFISLLWNTYMSYIANRRFSAHVDQID